MADFNNGYPDVITLNGRELFLLVDPLFNSGLNITVENFVEQYGVSEISDVPGLVDDLALKQTEININTNKLSTIEEGADVTDTENVEAALGISSAGSRDRYLSQQGTYEVAGSGTGGEVTKAAVDLAIGASNTGDSAQFYNEQGNFIDAVYDSIENAPIIRNATVETITIAGTRTNVQVQASGTNEFSTITLLDSFRAVPTQYTTTFTSPNTTFTPSLVFPAGSQGRQLSLTELDGTVHRFCYLVNGNYRVLAGGLTGTVRVGPVAVATTATVTAAVTVPDQTAGQTITLTGDETGTFSVGDFISPQANNFGAFRGIFVDSITFDGTNTVIVGPSNGATTFNTTSVLRNAGPATEIQGTFPTWSYTPDTAGSVYSSAITTRQFTGSTLTENIAEIVTAITGLETPIVQLGATTATTLGGEAASSFTFDLGTETNIDSTFAIAGGLNNMNSLVNTDGVPGVGQTVATTVTVIDPEATEVASQTFGVTDANDNNVDDVGNFINNAVNNNTEAPVDFISEYGSGVLTLTAQEAGNTNPWTIVINNNGATAANAGNLSTSTVQTGEQINQIDRLSALDTVSCNFLTSRYGDNVSIQMFGGLGSAASIEMNVGGESFIQFANVLGSKFVTVNKEREDQDWYFFKQTAGEWLTYNAGSDVTTIDSDTINFVANTITGLPTGSSTTVLGTTGEVDVTTVDTTATVSLSSTITDEITANTAKVGITTAQDTAITNNTAKNSYPTADATKLAGIATGATANVGDAVLANTQTFTGANTFSDTTIFSDTDLTNGSIQVAGLITHQGDTDTSINFGADTLSFNAGGLSLLVLQESPFVGNSLIFNNSRADVNYFFGKNTSGNWLQYDGGTDVMTVNAGNLVGVAEKETGTWSPTFGNGGTQGTIVATYSKAGNIVTVNVIATVGVGGVGFYTVSEASLPFTLANTTVTPSGTFLIGNDLAGFTLISSGFAVVFIKPDRSIVTGTEVSGQTAFTLTYETND